MPKKGDIQKKSKTKKKYIQKKITILQGFDKNTDFQNQQQSYSTQQQQYIDYYTNQDYYPTIQSTHTQPKKTINFIKPINLSEYNLPPKNPNYIVLTYKKPQKHKEEKIKLPYKAPIAPWIGYKTQKYPIINIIEEKEEKEEKQTIEDKEDNKQIIPVKDILEEKLYKSVMCKNILKKKKCYVPNCRFAHAEWELVSPKCGFGDSCLYKKTTCKFKHSDETEEEYRKRILEIIEFEKEAKKEKKKLMKKIKSKEKERKEKEEKDKKKQEKIKKEKKLAKLKKSKPIVQQPKIVVQQSKPIVQQPKKVKKSRWNIKPTIQQQSKPIVQQPKIVVQQPKKVKKSRWNIKPTIQQQSKPIFQQPKKVKKSRWNVKNISLEKELDILKKITPDLTLLNTEILNKYGWKVNINN